MAQKLGDVTMFIVKRKILDDLVSDPVWSERLEKAKATEDVKKVIVAFCKDKGYKVASWA